METEVHVYAFSVAANVLLSFFPFLIVMLTLCLHLLGARTAYGVINLALGDYFPDQMGSYIQRNLGAKVGTHATLQIVSLALLLFTANGVFEPLEVALNRAWGVTKNRSFVKNQMVSLGLIFVCGSLAMCSAIFTAMPLELTGAQGWLAKIIETVFFKIAAVPLSMVMLLLIYWVLPNRKLAVRDLIRPAVVVGLALEVLKYVNLLTWPMLRVKFAREYGPFAYSVTIVLWSFLAAMLILAGAEWSARQARERPEPAERAQLAAEGVARER
jgi:YihY family inner membrane protein